MDRIAIRRPDDFHVHLRTGPMLKLVLPHTARTCARALVMPNVRISVEPHVASAKDMLRYRSEIMECLPEGSGFEPLMTVSVTDRTMPHTVIAAKAAGAVAGKLYPVGSTTNSECGCSDIRSGHMRDVFAAMEGCGLVLSLHGEDPGVPSLLREEAFLPNLDWLVGAFPRLKIVLEHVSSMRGLAKVLALPDTVAATVTPHHLVLTLDDIVGGKLDPHHFCKPIAKTAEDREVLRKAVVGGCPKLFLGTDSAPHRDSDKTFGGAAGIFSAPVALPVLAQVFEEEGRLDSLEDFVSGFGADFYGLPRNGGRIELVRRAWSPKHCGGVTPFMYDRVLEWRVEER